VSSPRSLLLLSGGIDSTSLAYWRKPDYSLFIDYGQRAAVAERRAATAVANELGVVFDSMQINLAAAAGGLMAGGSVMEGAPSPEWWPFRNQLLISIAAAWACRNTNVLEDPGTVSIQLGIVRGDGERHVDGSARFVSAISALQELQEGRISVEAPALDLSTEDLVKRSAIPDALLAWTHSCHVASFPCMECPGCFKRERVLHDLGRLQ
tara:strand:- start:13324 stop:13950 length:627 start_codon:yes stop_codon:yes gene_type:complete